MADQDVSTSMAMAVDVTVFASPEIVADDWNNRIRDAAIKISSKIPEVGAVVGILVGFFWPQDKVDIFEALKAELTELIEKQILQHELELHTSEINALKGTIQRYQAAKDHEKAYWLTNWINDADKLSVIFRESSNNIHLILLVITLALLHLSGLRERLDFGKQLYGEDNTKQWKEDLEKMYETYIVDFLPSIFSKWKTWRADQVQIKAWTETHPTAIPPFFRIESHATVKDKVTDEKKHFSVDLTESTTIFDGICQAHKTRMCNDASADLAGGISTTFVFDNFLPDNNKKFPRYDKNVFGRMFRGPYSQDLLYSALSFGLGNPVPSLRTHPNVDDYSSSSGPITKVIVREWNTIDALQFIYANRQGQMAGNPRGGAEHGIDVSTNNPISALRMGFSNGLLTTVQIIYNDGTKSSTYGNRSGWRLAGENTPTAPTTYRVSSWSFRSDNGPSGTYGPSVVQLEYAPSIEAMQTNE